MQSLLPPVRILASPTTSRPYPRGHLVVFLLAVAVGGCASVEEAPPVPQPQPQATSAERPPGPCRNPWKNSACAYLQPGFNREDPAARRVAGNLTALTWAFVLSAWWSPSPRTAGDLAATLPFQAINLWDPYADAPAVLMEGPPPPSALPGTYFTWRGAGQQEFRAVTAEVVLEAAVLVREEEEAKGRFRLRTTGEVYEEPPGKRPLLAFCRVLGRVAYSTAFDFPGLLPAKDSPLETLEDLKAYWWLWDAEATLSKSPFQLSAIHLRPDPAVGAPPNPDCRTPEGSIWQWGSHELEREYATLGSSLPDTP